MKKIFLQGYYGINNLGDDYIMYSLLKNFVARGYSVRVLANKKGKATCKKIALSMGSKNIKYWFYNNKISKIIGLLLGILTSDIYIIGGGGLFPQEDRSSLNRQYGYIKFASILNTKTYLFGIEINSIKQNECKEIWKNIIDKCKLCITRNQYTKNMLCSVEGINKDKIKASFDLTFGFNTDAEENKEQLADLKNKKYVVWSLAMPFSDEELLSKRFEERFDRLCTTLIETIKSFPNDCYHVFLPFFGGRDVLIINKVIDGLKNSECWGHYSVIDESYSIDCKREIFHNAEFAVDMRFHSVMFSLFHETPFCAISYSPKTSEILSELELKNVYMEYGIRDSEFFYKEFDLDEAKFKEFVLEHFQKRLYMRHELQAVSKRLKDNVNSSYLELFRSIESV